MTPIELAQKIDRAYIGIFPFQDRYFSRPADQARATVKNTHYYDEDTLRYFRARVLCSRIFFEGLVHVGIESVSADYQHTNRIFRFVAHDIFGDVIERAPLDQAYRNRDQATKARDAWLVRFDAVAHTLEKLSALAARNRYHADKVGAILGAQQ